MNVKKSPRGKERRAARRQSKASVKYDLSSGTENKGGEYNPATREITLYREDPDVLKHEMTHAAQYGPLRTLASKAAKALDMEAPEGRIQNKEVRKAYKDFYKGFSPDQKLNFAGDYMANSGGEFEAIVSSATDAAQRMGVDLSGDFQQVKSKLFKQILDNPGSQATDMQNIRLLYGSMANSNNLSSSQKDALVRAIRANLQP